MSREFVRRQRQGSHSGEFANEQVDWTGKSQVEVDPVLHDLGHSFQVGQVARNLSGNLRLAVVGRPAKTINLGF
jgi:hypothetical protein